MHNETFDVKEFDSDEDAKKAGYKIPLTRAEASHVSGMNRKQRRDWARAQGKLGNNSKAHLE